MNEQGYASIPRAVLHDRTIPWAAKAVLLALSSYAGPDQEAWPSHAALAEAVSLSPTTVKRALIWLREHGHVTWQGRPRPDGGQSSNAYRIHYPPVPVTDPLGL